jgi:hypothetical protein
MTPTRDLRSYCPMTNVTEFKKKACGHLSEVHHVLTWSASTDPVWLTSGLSDPELHGIPNQIEL